MNKLRELRRRNKVTVSQIAEFVGISNTYYYELEKSEKRLNETLLRKFSDFYKVPIDYILGHTNSRDKNQIVTGLNRPNGYTQIKVPLEVREEVERYAKYLIEQYEKGEYKKRG